MKAFVVGFKINLNLTIHTQDTKLLSRTMKNDAVLAVCVCLLVSNYCTNKHSTRLQKFQVKEFLFYLVLLL